MPRWRVLHVPVLFRLLFPAFVILSQVFATGTASLPDYRFDPRLGHYLRSHGFSQESVTAAVESPRREPLAGDAVAAWVATAEGQDVKQWLLIVRRAAPAAGKDLADRKIYLSWGPVITFSSKPEQLDLELVGPLVAPPEGQAPKEGNEASPELAVRRIRIEFPGDFLRLGFVDRVAVGWRIEQAQQAHAEIKRWHLYSQTQPIKSEAVSEARKYAALIGFNPAEERAFACCGVVLQSLLKLGMDTPGLKDICLRVVDRPSLFQMAKILAGGLTKTTFGRGLPTRGIPGAADAHTIVDKVPISIGFEKDTMAELSLFVTEPRPPLDLFAGVVGCIAVHPKDKTKVVQVLLVGANAVR